MARSAFQMMSEWLFSGHNDMEALVLHFLVVLVDLLGLLLNLQLYCTVLPLVCNLRHHCIEDLPLVRLLTCRAWPWCNDGFTNNSYVRSSENFCTNFIIV